MSDLEQTKMKIVQEREKTSQRRHLKDIVGT
jgi:hypothetical protein